MYMYKRSGGILHQIQKLQQNLSNLGYSNTLVLYSHKNGFKNDIKR